MFRHCFFDRGLAAGAPGNQSAFEPCWYLPRWNLQTQMRIHPYRTEQCPRIIGRFLTESIGASDAQLN